MKMAVLRPPFLFKDFIYEIGFGDVNITVDARLSAVGSACQESIAT